MKLELETHIGRQTEEEELARNEEEPDLAVSGEEEPVGRSSEEDISTVAYILDLIFSVVVIFGIAWFIRMVVVSPFYVDGESMMPTLENSDFLVVDKFSYYLTEPSRGDVVIFRPPNQPNVFYVKRIIGLPGETIEFVDGEVKIRNNNHPDGWILPEEYLSQENDGKTYIPSHKNRKVYIPEGRYFMMGDNRNHSSDSRNWITMYPDTGGTIPEKMIVGRARVRVWIPEQIFWKIGIPYFDTVPRTEYIES